MKDTKPSFWKGTYGLWASPKLHSVLLHFPFFSDPMVQQSRKLAVGCDYLLEAGCGSGKIMLAVSQSCKYVVGLEFDKANAKNAKKNLRSCSVSNYDMVIGDVRHLPFRGKIFGCVTSFGVIEHFLDPLYLLIEMKSVLSSSGKLLLSTPDKNAYFSERERSRCRVRYGHHDFYSPGELRNLVQQAGMRPSLWFNCGFFWSFAMWMIQKLRTREPLSHLIVLLSFFLFFSSYLVELISPDRGFYSMAVGHVK